MEKIVLQGTLYDFYGKLLTPHQQKVYEDAVYENLSLSELSQAYGISRQAVHDLLKRCDKILMDYEKDLGLVSKFESVRADVEKIEKLAAQNDAVKEEISRTAQHILELL